VDTWRIVPMKGGSRTITHPVIAVAPGCPTERHPTRWCQCKVFPSKTQAQQHVDAKAGSSGGAP
jgi:hypothetical protein